MHQLAMISNGRVLASGQPEDLRAAVRGRFYELEADSLGAALQTAKQHPSVRDAWITGSMLRLASEGPLETAVLEGIGRNARPVPPTLEDAFVALSRTPLEARA